MSDKDFNSSQYKSGASAGELLRSARETLGLSIDEIASRLCLSVQYLQHIEKDDYSLFAARTYARGYVLSYARLLDISDEKILPAFISVASQFDLTKHSVINVASFKTEGSSVPIYQDDDRQQHSNFIWWVSAFIILLLAGLVVMWAQGPRMADKNAGSNMVANVSSTAVPLQADDQSTGSNSANADTNTNQTMATAFAPVIKSDPPQQATKSVSASNSSDVALPAPQQTSNN